MRWRLACLGALLLPDLALDPFRGGLAASMRHPLGTDDLGRDALLRLALAAGRSLGFASGCALLALGLGLLLAWRGQRLQGAWSALRSLPPLLFLLPLAAALGGLPALPLGLLLGGLLAPHLEPALRTQVDGFRRSPAWAAERTLGGTLVLDPLALGALGLAAGRRPLPQRLARGPLGRGHPRHPGSGPRAGPRQPGPPAGGGAAPARCRSLPPGLGGPGDGAPAGLDFGAGG